MRSFCKLILVLTAGVSAISSDPEIIKLTIQPFDFQVEDQPNTHVVGMVELYSTGKVPVYLPKEDPTVIVINPNTREIQRFGGVGQGPGELGRYPAGGLSVRESSIWALNDRKTHANLFVEGQFQTSFRLKDYQVRDPYLVTWSFAHNDQLVVIPAHPRTGSLARVYDYSGQEIAMMGKILPIEPEMLRYNRAVNATLWQYANNRWFCLFVYRPKVRIFNAAFELEKEIPIVGEEVDHFEQYFQKRELPEGFGFAPTHFNDFQVTKKFIYIVCRGVLYQLNHEGELLTKTQFWANEEVEEELGWLPQVRFKYVAVLTSGKIFLGTLDDYMDHDLWFVDAPHVKE